MACITKHSFKNPSRKREKIDVPECGVDAYVYIEELSARSLQELRKQHHPVKDDAYFDFEFDLLSLSLVDEVGERLYASPDELRCEGELSLVTLQRLVKEALRVSGLDAPKN